MNTPEIESYRFGRIVVDGQVHTADLIILPHQVLGNWWRREGHSLHPDDLKPVLDGRPEVLVVGQGANGLMVVPPNTRQALEDAGIELIALPTEEACRSYNAMRASRIVAAALHLTC